MKATDSREPITCTNCGADRMSCQVKGRPRRATLLPPVQSHNPNQGEMMRHENLAQYAHLLADADAGYYTLPDDMNHIIRRAAGLAEPGPEPAEQRAPSFDGGARTPAPPAPPSMDELLRAAVLSKTDHLPPDQALRQVRFEQTLRRT